MHGKVFELLKEKYGITRITWQEGHPEGRLVTYIWDENGIEKTVMLGSPHTATGKTFKEPANLSFEQVKVALWDKETLFDLVDGCAWGYWRMIQSQ